MTTTVTPVSDPAALAASVRALACRAHKALNESATHPAELRSLLQQARGLRAQVQDWPSDDLPHWLEHVQRRLENA
ncbi:MAG: hypothetical protein P4L84_07755 [Isosphaeraceae bacterium]|nr:hypothetical protein [Isosphaeraceae bacterium]